jgi:hypothetical protein
LHAQDGEIYFTHFQTEDGLPSREVYCIAQDSMGYFWFGTDNGISRFDGYEFKNYQVNNNYEANVINSILVKKNKIWFGSMFLGAYYLDKDNLQPYKYNYLLEKYKGKYITATLEYISDEEDFYFSLFNYGIVKIDRFGKITEYTIKDGFGYIFLNINHTIIGTRSSHIKDDKKMDSKQAVFEYYTNKKYRFKINTHSISKAKMFRQKEGIDKSFSFYHNYLYTVKNEKAERFPIKTIVNTMLTDIDEKIYIGFGESKGLGIAKNLEALKKGDFKKYLSNNNVSSVYLDSHKNLWVTTTNNGVFFCKSPNQIVYFSTASKKESFISAIEPIDEEECYFGTSNGEIFHLKNNAYNAIAKYPQAVYFCHELNYNAHNKKLYSYGGYYKNGKWHEIKLVNMKHGSVYKNFSLDTISDNVWFANYSNYGYFDKDNSLVVYSGIIEKEFIRIFDILYQNDTLWLATQNGLYASRKGTNPCIPILKNTVSERINCIAGDHSNNLYLGTKESGIFVRKNSGQCFVINKNTGLVTNNIKNIFVSKNGTMWVCSNLGLDKVSFDANGNHTVRNFNTAHGLPSNEIYQAKSTNGILWIATGKGLIKFIDKPINQYSPKPIISSVSASNKGIEPNTNFILKYRENNILIKYKTINPLLANKIKYRYKFSNTSKWIYTSSTSLEFVELQSGLYNLYIQSANEDNIWSQSTVLTFGVDTPWWKKWEFYFILVILGSVCMYYFLKYRTLRLTKESRLRLELNQLEKLALQNQMNPHFLSNSFTSLQYLINTNKTEQADEYLSDLSRLLRKILDSSRSNEVSLRQEIELIKLYIQLEKIRFENKFNYTIKIHESIDLDKEKLPPMMIQPILENAINHAFTDPMQKSNNILIDFFQDENFTYCTVKDNGIGLYKSLSLKSDENTRKSYALTIIKDRINNYNLSNKFKIEIDFIDNFESYNESGTSVKFSFPKNL